MSNRYKCDGILRRSQCFLLFVMSETCARFLHWMTRNQLAEEVLKVAWRHCGESSAAMFLRALR